MLRHIEKNYVIYSRLESSAGRVYLYENGTYVATASSTVTIWQQSVNSSKQYAAGAVKQST